MEFGRRRQLGSGNRTGLLYNSIRLDNSIRFGNMLRLSFNNKYKCNSFVFLSLFVDLFVPFKYYVFETLLKEHQSILRVVMLCTLGKLWEGQHKKLFHIPLETSLKCHLVTTLSPYQFTFVYVSLFRIWVFSNSHFLTIKLPNGLGPTVFGLLLQLGSSCILVLWEILTFFVLEKLQDKFQNYLAFKINHCVSLAHFELVIFFYKQLSLP